MVKLLVLVFVAPLVPSILKSFAYFLATLYVHGSIDSCSSLKHGTRPGSSSVVVDDAPATVPAESFFDIPSEILGFINDTFHDTTVATVQ